MNLFFILAQVTAIIGWLLLVYSYYKEDIDDLLWVQIISSIFYCFNYIFLGAVSGLVVCLFELIKEIGYYKTTKDDLILKMSFPIYLIIAFFTFESWISLLPIMASIIDSIALTKSRNKAVVGGVISNFLWVIYDIYILAYFCALTDGILVLSNLCLLIIGYSRIIKSDKLRFIKTKYLSKNAFNAIYELDKRNYKDEYLWPIAYQKQIYFKDKDSFILLKEKNKVVGYINYFFITEEKFKQILASNKMINEYDLNDITKKYKTKKNYLVIESINVEKKFQNYKIISKIKNRLKKLIKDNYKNGYIISNIVSTSVNSFEEAILKEAFFEEYKKYENHEKLFIIDNDKIDNYYLTKEYIEKGNKNNYKILLVDQINDNVFNDINKLDSKFFEKEYLWDTNYQKEIFEKNKNSFVIVTYKNKVIGYINYLCITKEKYFDMVNSNFTTDKFAFEDISKYKKNKKNYLTLNSVVIEKDFQNSYAVKLIKKEFVKNIKFLIKNHYIIEEINSIAITNDGKKFLEQLFFEKKKELNDNNTLYILTKDKIKQHF